MAAPVEPTWVELLEDRTEFLINELVPTKLLPFLSLPACDKENIIADERNNGPIEASITLLDRLKKRNGSNGKKTFDGFVRALRKVGNQQSALLLDPHFQGNYK